MNELTEIGLKISLSALLAGAVGAEREWTGKWAGLRTHMLMAVGATLLTHLSLQAGPGGGPGTGSGTWDGGRIAAQIVTGVGFIGGGTILQSRGAVHGLTTAAGLWVAAAIGIAIGFSDYVAGIVTTVALLIILTALRPFERLLQRGHLRTVVLQLEKGQKVSQVMECIEESAVETEGIEVSRRGPQPALIVKLRGLEGDARRLVEHANLHGIRALDETEPKRPPFP
ncbi:MAG TPA: MgtC/SapB family protein [Thermoanaerobaculia bacterium]|nr:MgtC/SapB family protein [Thermoanaerobaculia bacterium]